MRTEKTPCQFNQNKTLLWKPQAWHPTIITGATCNNGFCISSSAASRSALFPYHFLPCSAYFAFAANCSGMQPTSSCMLNSKQNSLVVYTNYGITYWRCECRQLSLRSGSFWIRHSPPPVNATPLHPPAVRQEKFVVKESLSSSYFLAKQGTIPQCTSSQPPLVHIDNAALHRPPEATFALDQAGWPTEDSTPELKVGMSKFEGFSRVSIMCVRHFIRTWHPAALNNPTQSLLGTQLTPSETRIAPSKITKFNGITTQLAYPVSAFRLAPHTSGSFGNS